MLEIASTLKDNLPEIEVVFANDGGKAEDDPTQYALVAGLMYPIVMVSKTVLAADDIAAFKLSLGISTHVPKFMVTIADPYGDFRETDYISADSDIVLWIGCRRFDADDDKTVDKPKPIKLAMQAKTIQLRNSKIIVNGVLKLPTNRFSIVKDTVENMLRAFADATGIGVLCNYDLTSENVDKNFINVTAEEFMQDFASFIGIDNWYIDDQYNYCLLAIDKTCAEHKELECRSLFSSYAELKEPQKVRYTNYLNDMTQFKYVQYGYSFIDRNNALPVVENVLYDKSVELNDTAYQRTESNFLAKPQPIDVDNIYFEADFDPYKLVGKTFQIDAYTSAGYAKRQTIEQYESGTKPPTGQQKIEDVCGVYMLTDVSYLLTGKGPMQAWTSFQKPAEQNA